MGSLTGRLAVVTGAASGIGEGIAQVLAEAGATVIIADIVGDKAAAVAKRLRDLGRQAANIIVNLADEASVVSACAAIVADHGTPWALVNNAGLQDRQLLLDTSAFEWDQTFAVNTRGPFLMTREIGRAMIAGGQGGRIVNIASASVIGSITKGHAAYASSKSALLGLARASALEFAEHRVTVNTILPGGVITPGVFTATGPTPEGPALRTPPLALAEPRDIGAAALFFVSDAARKITNQVLAVDGGWSVT